VLGNTLRDIRDVNYQNLCFGYSTSHFYDTSVCGNVCGQAYIKINIKIIMFKRLKL
jgi:hypothetical protein